MHITPQPSNELADGEAEMASIHPDVQIEGTVRVVQGRGIAIRGSVHGPIECDGTVVVHDGATVHGTVQADRVVVAGEVKAGPQGGIVARSLLQLKPTGFIQAHRVRYGALEAERGGRLAGELCPVEASAQRQVDIPRTRVQIGVPSAGAPNGANSSTSSAPQPAPASTAAVPAVASAPSTPSNASAPTPAAALIAAPASAGAAVMPLRSAAVIDLAPAALQDHHEISDDSGPDMAAPAEMHFQQR